jgi:hypothetical protein
LYAVCAVAVTGHQAVESVCKYNSLLIITIQYEKKTLKIEEILFDVIA